MKVQQFFDTWNNKPCEVESPEYKNQCFDLALAYCDFLGIPRDAIRHLYAYQIQTQPNDLTVQHFELIPNTPNGVPQEGDMVIWGTSIGIAGHVAIATGYGDANGFKSMDQNWPSGTICHFQDHTYNGVIGWLRPRQLHVVEPVVIPITDQTQIHIGNNPAQSHDWGEMEVGAIRSTIFDQENKISSQAAELSVVNNKYAELLNKPQLVVTTSQEESTTYPTIADFSTNQLVSELFRRISGTWKIS